MIAVEVDLIGIAPYSQSQNVQSERQQSESHDVFERRVWREHMHTDPKGQVFVPPTALKNALSEIAKYLSESVPGKGKKTWTKYFESGLLVTDPILLFRSKKPVMAADVECERLFLPSDGIRGSGKRVWKHYPIIREWSGHATIHVVERALIDKPQKIAEYLEQAGSLIGFGRFRPSKNGYYGRFRTENFRVVE